MTKVLNLNRARKTKNREKARQKADANAVKFGRTKAERARNENDAKASERFLDDHKRER